jgi:hypothetical protein
MSLVKSISFCLETRTLETDDEADEEEVGAVLFNWDLLSPLLL